MKTLPFLPLKRELDDANLHILSAGEHPFSTMLTGIATDGPTCPTLQAAHTADDETKFDPILFIHHPLKTSQNLERLFSFPG